MKYAQSLALPPPSYLLSTRLPRASLTTSNALSPRQRLDITRAVFTCTQISAMHRPRRSARSQTSRQRPRGGKRLKGEEIGRGLFGNSSMLMIDQDIVRRGAVLPLINGYWSSHVGDAMIPLSIRDTEIHAWKSNTPCLYGVLSCQSVTVCWEQKASVEYFHVSQALVTTAI